MKRLFITSAIALLGFAGMASGAFAQAQAPSQQQFPPVQIQNRVVLSPQTAENPNPSQPAPEQTPAIIRNQETIIVRSPYESVNSQMGDIKLETPGPMNSDSVYVDGAYVGVAGDISDIQVPPGAHEVMLAAPDGTPVYRDAVGVAQEETSEVMPTEAFNNGVTAPSAVTYSAPQPSLQGNLRLSTPWTLRNDAVFIDGTYVGLARTIRNLTLTPGTHNVALCAPDGNTDYQQDVGIALSETTRLRPNFNG